MGGQLVKVGGAKRRQAEHVISAAIVKLWSWKGIDPSSRLEVG
jgi:hypothetical protein